MMESAYGSLRTLLWLFALCVVLATAENLPGEVELPPEASITGGLGKTVRSMDSGETK